MLEVIQTGKKEKLVIGISFPCDIHPYFNSEVDVFCVQLTKKQRNDINCWRESNKIINDIIRIKIPNHETDTLIPFIGELVHKADIYTITEEDVLKSKSGVISIPKEFDGMYIPPSLYGKVLPSMLGADCPPVCIMVDGHTLSLHCGWKPLYHGIIENGFKILDQKGADFTKDIKVIVGSRIKNYEVGEDMREKFLKHNYFCNYIEELFVETSIKDKYHFNLLMCISLAMHRCSQIYNDFTYTIKSDSKGTGEPIRPSRRGENPDSFLFVPIPLKEIKKSLNGTST